jgi:hypothetical protein
MGVHVCYLYPDISQLSLPQENSRLSLYSPSNQAYNSVYKKKVLCHLAVQPRERRQLTFIESTLLHPPPKALHNPFFLVERWGP